MTNRLHLGYEDKIWLLADSVDVKDLLEDLSEAAKTGDRGGDLGTAFVEFHGRYEPRDQPGRYSVLVRRRVAATAGGAYLLT